MYVHRFDPLSALLGLVLIGCGGIVITDRLGLVEVTASAIGRWTVPVLLVLLGLLVVSGVVSSAQRRRRSHHG